MAGLHPDGSNSSLFAIRSGGHSTVAGAANINAGVTIDLRSLNAIHVVPNQTVTSVGAGTIWNDVYEKLIPMNLTVLGARVAGLGVGGFTTGGMHEFFPRSFKTGLIVELRWDLVLFAAERFCL